MSNTGNDNVKCRFVLFNFEARARIKDEYQLNGGEGECLMYGQARRERALPFNLRWDRSLWTGLIYQNHTAVQSIECVLMVIVTEFNYRLNNRART